MRQLREGKTEGEVTFMMLFSGFVMATSLCRVGKAWPSLSSSTHSDISLLLMCSLWSEVWVKVGSRVTEE